MVHDPHAATARWRSSYVDGQHLGPWWTRRLSKERCGKQVRPNCVMLATEAGPAMPVIPNLVCTNTRKPFAKIDGRFFYVHGGISPELLKVDDMRRLNRFMEPRSHGLLCDLLWADPNPSFRHESESGAHPALAPGTTFVHNQTRGCSFFYTYGAACQFLERNGLLGIISGHEAQNDGFPSVITIFLAPNYLDVYRNRGAVLKYQDKNITIRLPFVGAKIAEILLAVLSVCSQEELVDSESDSEDEETKAGPDAAARRQQIKSKIIAVGRMQRVFQLLREEAENATELNVGGPPSDGTPANASGGHSDILNEHLPEFAQTQQTIFPAPSMRVYIPLGGQPGILSGEGGHLRIRLMVGVEHLREEQYQLLEEDEEQGSMVERLADSIVRARKAGVLGKPEPLKRHRTT
ncbi:Metallo-dependent phosphatase [Pluteus cervinus]|uniref:Metallo-dependent phosphatase n=1 Tax=Pluteus cervinus TaxID=181527 RepID=A0ACD3AC49_9AGAR|nr:Metallo-dependent phosphatase [Pluteus cervinus]